MPNQKIEWNFESLKTYGRKSKEDCNVDDETGNPFMKINSNHLDEGIDITGGLNDINNNLVENSSNYINKLSNEANSLSKRSSNIDSLILKRNDTKSTSVTNGKKMNPEIEEAMKKNSNGVQNPKEGKNNNISKVERFKKCFDGDEDR